MSEPDWPEYGVGASSDHIYAIGVLIANWNDVEAQMFRLMKSLIRNDKLATGLFYNMHNADRLNIIKLLSDDLEDDQDKDYVATFVRHASLCNQNRNILAHTEFSTILFSDDIMLGQKVTDKGNKKSSYTFSLGQLRKAADETRETFEFARDITMWILAPIRIEKERFFKTEDVFTIIAKEEAHIHKAKQPAAPVQPSVLTPRHDLALALRTLQLRPYRQ